MNKNIKNEEGFIAFFEHQFFYDKVKCVIGLLLMSSLLPFLIDLFIFLFCFANKGYHKQTTFFVMIVGTAMVILAIIASIYAIIQKKRETLNNLWKAKICCFVTALSFCFMGLTVVGYKGIFFILVTFPLIAIVSVIVIRKRIREGYYCKENEDKRKNKTGIGFGTLFVCGTILKYTIGVQAGMYLCIFGFGLGGIYALVFYIMKYYYARKYDLIEHMK